MNPFLSHCLGRMVRMSPRIHTGSPVRAEAACDLSKAILNQGIVSLLIILDPGITLLSRNVNDYVKKKAA